MEVKTRKQLKYEKRKQKRLDKQRKEHEIYNNFEWVFSFDHLIEAAFMCKRNVNWKASVQLFHRELYYNVYCVYEDLMEHKFKVRSTYEFDTFERGKRRHIRSVHIRERIVQRVLCDYCLLPMFTKSFIYDSGATLKGKGTDFALNRIKAHLQQYYRKYGNTGYVLMFDFKDFFNSISADLVMKIAREKVWNEDILEVIQLFVNMTNSDGGLGLGSQISQVFALAAASPIDHLIKDKYRVRHYVRYMDDGVIIHNDKEFLKELLIEIDKMAQDLGLNLNKKKTHITKLEKGFKFLKKRISIDENGKISYRIDRTSITRMRRKLKKFYNLYKDGKMSMENVSQAYHSWRGFSLKYNSYRTVMNMDKLYNSIYAEQT